jgi:hypothetical protein
LPITVFAEKLMADDAEGVVRKVIEVAKAGDMTAARLILDRIAPVRRGRPVVFDLPSVGTAADGVAALGAVVLSVASGDLTPEEATAVATVIDIKRRAIETAELETRLRAIEERIGTGEQSD